MQFFIENLSFLMHITDYLVFKLVLSSNSLNTKIYKNEIKKRIGHIFYNVLIKMFAVANTK